MDSTSFKESTPTGPKFGEVSAKKLAKSEEASANRFRASSTAVLPSGVVFKHAADAFNMLLLRRERVSNKSSTRSKLVLERSRMPLMESGV